MQKLENAFVEANKWALILLLGAMSCIVFANVTLRYTTNYSIYWAEEVARYMMIWLTFLGAGLTLRYGGHVAITNLMEIMPTQKQRLLRGFIVICLIAFFAVMIWVGYGYAMRMRFQMTPATRIPFAYVYAAMPVGFALLIIHLLLVVRSYVRDNRFEETTEAGDIAGSLSA
ncbi:MULTISPECIES: TRAP transporter small permease [unclassified Aminobacter]|uniref:TRAP transporter small permease n=1 Tax=unclassified Aminobacter TaxID=2644704 RepID=UPI00046319B4|nr:MULTISPECIES: TRAP transporter small permease [unclassified Aminobacter]TWG65588.1 TRAP-type C4-dicarboxylate transport system permease small subunit [Aminobacter sp. J44]TWH36298.1 TRAP-type C4-dicarboxylate transport system permease small subunit [Aminobacter sp. J15]